MFAETIDILILPKEKVPNPDAGKLTTGTAATEFIRSCILIEEDFNCFRKAVLRQQKLADVLFWGCNFWTRNSFNAVPKIFTNFDTDYTRNNNFLFG